MNVISNFVARWALFLGAAAILAGLAAIYLGSPEGAGRHSVLISIDSWDPGPEPGSLRKPTDSQIRAAQEIWRRKRSEP